MGIKPSAEIPGEDPGAILGNDQVGEVYANIRLVAINIDAVVAVSEDMDAFLAAAGNIATVVGAADAAAGSAAAALVSQNAAAASATTAGNHVTTAGNYATTALAYRDAANASSVSADASKTAAAGSATTAAGHVTTTAANVAAAAAHVVTAAGHVATSLTYKNDAAASATAAANSATASANSATAAGNSATAAAGSATAAQTAKTAAELAETNAEEAETNAELAEASAETARDLAIAARVAAEVARDEAQAIAGGNFIPISQKGIADGVVPLDATTKISISFLPDAVLGTMRFQSVWNANTNTPAIPVAAAGNRGHYYRVGTAGTTMVDGTNDWQIGDWIVSNGTTWDKIDNSEFVPGIADITGLQAALDAKLDDSQAGAFGLTLLTSVDLAAAKVSLAYTKADVGLTDVDNTSDVNKPVSTTQQTALNLKAALAGGNNFTGDQNVTGVLTIISAAGNSSIELSGNGYAGEVRQNSDGYLYLSSGGPGVTFYHGNFAGQIALFSDGAASFNGSVSAGTDNAYGPAWDGSLRLATENAIYDKIIALEGLVVGAMVYQGTWNATTNTPAIPVAAAGNKGFYYKVATAGTTNIDGIADWGTGDWIVSNGVTWDKIDNSETVSSVAGKVGAVTLVKGDVGLGNADNTSDANKPVSAPQQTALDGKSNARPSIGTLTASRAASDADNNTHLTASGVGQTLTLGNITAGTSFTVRFTTAWSFACAGGLSKNGAAPGAVTTGSVSANKLITFLHEGAGVWVASGDGLT